jgi:ABC-type nitrate/sulfonate/bicarbonate transport system permease component
LENELLNSPPSGVLSSLWNLTVTGKLNQHLAATLLEFTYGFTTACITGIVIGHFIGFISLPRVGFLNFSVFRKLSALGIRMPFREKQKSTGYTFHGK